MIRRCALLLSTVTLAYLAQNQMGPVGWYVHDALTPPVARNGYSAYTDYERCHIDEHGVIHDYYTHRKDC